jgi:hypothetical protein
MNLSTYSSTFCKLALGTLIALGAGCLGGDDDLETSATIASVTLANGNTVDFYESSPGVLLVSETGTVGIAPIPNTRMRPLDLYRSLAPDQPVPEALVAAQARADARNPEPEPPTDEPAARQPSPAAGIAVGYIDNQSCDDHWFDNTFCIGSYDWKMCLLNHLNGAYAQSSSVDYVRHTVCSDIGAITLKVQMGDGRGVIKDVPEGSWYSWWWVDDCTFGCNTSTRGDVVNATNNRFHYSVNINY